MAHQVARQGVAAVVATSRTVEMGVVVGGKLCRFAAGILHVHLFPSSSLSLWTSCSYFEYV
jgi:hypothetical protein